MSRIRILDEVTAGQIAAGEVVERPVSVVKELVENSLDSGADQISVEITEGGKVGITVSDNGCGMSQEEVSLAFCRHATSKITCAQDLYSLTTLGFRGEALPSIAAVSHLVLKSKMPGENVGHRIELRGGEMLSLQPVGCSSGTSVIVTDLFYNTPARRKHLKSKGTESGLIANMMQNMSFTRPGVRFLLKHNNKVVFRTFGSGKLVDTLSAVYGVEIASEMLEIKAEQNNVSLMGYISKPSVNRSTRSYITVIINGRYLKSKLISDAVDAAYRSLIPSGRHPIVVLDLSISPELLDVNIHPAKMEIRIDNGNEISKFIEYTIRKRLKNAVLIPRYSRLHLGTNEPFGTLRESKKVISYEEYQDGQKNQSEKFQEYLQESFDYSAENGQNKSLSEPQIFFKENTHVISSEGKVSVRDTGGQGPIKKEKESRFPFLQVIGQLLPTYIMASGPDGLYILDQHAAHERILFEKFLSSFHKANNQTQMLLTPVPLELNYSSLNILQEKLSSFEALGFILEEFGSGTYVLRGVPAHLSTSEGVRQFIDLIDDLTVLGKEKDFNRALITRLACRAAIKSGEVVSLKAMEAIVEQLSCTDEPYTCPHGRPTLVKITERELAQMFRRSN